LAETMIVATMHMTVLPLLCRYKIFLSLSSSKRRSMGSKLETSGEYF